MRAKRIEQTVVALLFVLVLVVFSFAQRDSKKLDRLYKTALLIQKDQPTPTVQSHIAPGKSISN